MIEDLLANARLTEQRALLQEREAERVDDHLDHVTQLLALCFVSAEGAREQSEPGIEPLFEDALDESAVLLALEGLPRT